MGKIWLALWHCEELKENEMRMRNKMLQSEVGLTVSNLSPTGG